MAAALLAVTAYKGGELVYRHGLGVLSLPETHEGAPGPPHGHHHGGEPHDHGGGDDHMH